MYFFKTMANKWKINEYIFNKLQIPFGIKYPIHSNAGNIIEHSVEYSASTLTHSVQASDCNIFNYCYGGVTMKLMDNVAGMVAFRHTHCNIVTASIGKLCQLLCIFIHNNRV